MVGLESATALPAQSLRSRVANTKGWPATHQYPSVPISYGSEVTTTSHGCLNRNRTVFWHRDIVPVLASDHDFFKWGKSERTTRGNTDLSSDITKPLEWIHLAVHIPHFVGELYEKSVGSIRHFQRLVPVPQSRQGGSCWCGPFTGGCHITIVNFHSRIWLAIPICHSPPTFLLEKNLPGTLVIHLHYGSSISFHIPTISKFCTTNSAQLPPPGLWLTMRVTVPEEPLEI